MSEGVDVVGLYVRDQDEALAFYVEKLGFRVHTDVRCVAIPGEVAAAR